MHHMKGVPEPWRSVNLALVTEIERRTADANLARFRRELDHVRLTGTAQEYSNILLRVLRMTVERTMRETA